MDIQNHRMADIWYRESSNLSGQISPKLIVMHYTTGWSGSGSRDWLLGAAGGTSNRETSCHIVIDRDGAAWQIAPFNRRAHHAGKSTYGGLTDLNTHSIGIEFVNPGWLEPDGAGGWLDPYKRRKTSAELEAFGGFIQQPHPRVGGQVYAWPNYTAPQVETGRAIVRALLREYPIRAIVTHEEIDTRGWKTDPGPAFPLHAFVQLLDAHHEAPLDRYFVTATRLNIRGAPSAAAERIDPPGALNQNTGLAVLRRDGDWAYAEALDGPHAGVRGWVHAGYIAIAI